MTTPNPTSSAAIRESFLKYFESQGHTRVKSSSLIPAADPTLMFTAAGMVQFKDAFQGTRDFGYRRATSAQKCVRAGGKHNDLENVGFTPRHHTFFEMLGNFSFGDYFKPEAIAFAWELVTEKFRIPKDRLFITVYKDDDEAETLWKKIGVPANRIERLGEKDNFWAAGDTGPCGPCTEIYYDWGTDFATPGGGGTPGTDDRRFFEIWNLVFMQFDRKADGSMPKLPRPSVDTGSGLERMACVLQGKFSNYDTDVFTPIFAAIEKRTGKTYKANEDEAVAMRVVADHLRASSMLMADGVVPSNEGRGYVLRRILRRAVRYGKKLGQDAPFLYDLLPALVATLGDVYPEIQTQEKLVATQLHEEETKFHETLHRGMGLFEETLAEMAKRNQKVLPGAIAFKLYDTFGFPLDLVEVMCREKNLTVDHAGFDEGMAKQREQSGGAKAAKSSVPDVPRDLPRPVFTGYDGTEEAKAKLLFLQDGYAMFSSTPFYAEGGGQVGDRGEIFSGGEKVATVLDTVKSKDGVPLMRVEGNLSVGKDYRLIVDHERRMRTAANHTATHLLHAALRTVLGDRVRQAGSLVEPEKLRFDFTYPKALTAQEKERLEQMVNAEVRANRAVVKSEMTYDEAIQSGALAFFDEKYGDRVRVVRVEGGSTPFSVELCGGTHLDRLSDVAVFRIISESSVASGVRRIEAVTGFGAIDWLLERDQVLGGVERMLKTTGAQVGTQVEKLEKDLQAARKEIETLRVKAAQGGGGGTALHDKKRDVGPYQLVAEVLTDVDAKALRTLVDQVRDKLKERTVVLLGTGSGGKATVCLGVSKDLVDRLDAGKLVQTVAADLGGTGGGKKDFAQAGGPAPEKLADAFARFAERLAKA